MHQNIMCSSAIFSSHVDCMVESTGYRDMMSAGLFVPGRYIT